MQNRPTRVPFVRQAMPERDKWSHGAARCRPYVPKKAQKTLMRQPTRSSGSVDQAPPTSPVQHKQPATLMSQQPMQQLHEVC